MCEELKHIINEGSLHFVHVHYKISTYTKHYRLRKEWVGAGGTAQDPVMEVIQ